MVMRQPLTKTEVTVQPPIFFTVCSQPTTRILGRIYIYKMYNNENNALKENKLTENIL